MIEGDDRQVCTCWCAGRHLSQLPVDAGVGKLLVLGAALGCLSTCLTVAACLSYRTPFASSQDQQDAAGRVRQAMAAPGAFPVVRMPYYPLLCTLYGLACMEFQEFQDMLCMLVGQKSNVCNIASSGYNLLLCCMNTSNQGSCDRLLVVAA